MGVDRSNFIVSQEVLHRFSVYEDVRKFSSHAIFQLTMKKGSALILTLLRSSRGNVGGGIKGDQRPVSIGHAHAASSCVPGHAHCRLCQSYGHAHRRPRENNGHAHRTGRGRHYPGGSGEHAHRWRPRQVSFQGWYSRYSLSFDLA